MPAPSYHHPVWAFINIQFTTNAAKQEKKNLEIFFFLDKRIL